MTRELCRRVQRRVLVRVEQVALLGLVVPPHHLTSLDEQREHSGVPARAAGRVQRREPLHLLVEHRVRAVLHEGAHCRHVTKRACPVKGRLAVRVEHVHLRAHREKEGDAHLVAELRRQVKQRRSALCDAVDVDDRLLQQNLENFEVAVLKGPLKSRAVGGVAQVKRRARVQEQLDNAFLARLGADDERRLPLPVLL